MGVEAAFPAKSGLFNRYSRTAGLLARHCPNQLGVCAMTGLDRNDVTVNAPAQQCKIADNIEYLVAHEFVVEAQRLLAQNRFAPDDDCVLEAAAFNQIL